MTKHITIAFGIIVGLIIVGLYSFGTFTKSFSPEAIAKYTGRNGLEIKVTYSRPRKKGRDLFGNENSLIPYGEIWRTGANEATEITFNKDVKINGKILKSGSYTLYTIPDRVSWTVIFNNELYQWGAFNYDPSKDALRVKVPVMKKPGETEMFTIDFREIDDQAEMRLFWGQTLVAIPISTIS